MVLVIPRMASKGYNPKKNNDNVPVALSLTLNMYKKLYFDSIHLVTKVPGSGHLLVSKNMYTHVHVEMRNIPKNLFTGYL